MHFVADVTVHSKLKGFHFVDKRTVNEFLKIPLKKRQILKSNCQRERIILDLMMKMNVVQRVFRLIFMGKS